MSSSSVMASYLTLNASSSLLADGIATTLNNATLATEISENEAAHAPSRPWLDYPEARVGTALIAYVYPVVIALGTVGNVLSVAVLTRRSMRATSVYLYLAVLALADLAVLYLSGLRAWARQVFGAELLHTSSFGCKAVMFLFLVSLHLSAWLVVAMTVDRFVAVWFPFKAAELCSVPRARLICLVTTLTIVLYNFHVLFTIDLHNLGYKWHCGAMRGDYFMTTVFPTMKLISYSILPFALVLLFNGAIIVRLWLSRSFVARAARGGGGGGSGTSVGNLRTDGGGGASGSDSAMAARRAPQHKDYFQVTVMLLSVSLTWLVLTGPFTLEPLVRFDPGSRTPHSMAQLFLSKSVCFLLLYVNHSVNFYIYCVTGRRFRLQLFDLLCSCRHRARARAGGATGSRYYGASGTARRLQSNIESRTSRTHIPLQSGRHLGNHNSSTNDHHGAGVGTGMQGNNKHCNNANNVGGSNNALQSNGESLPLRKTVMVTYNEA